MYRITVSRTINAPREVVFGTVADIQQFAKAVPHITQFEFLSDKKIGEGTRFRETRLMGSREAKTELEVTEFVESKRVRLVSDTHGTIWDTLFTVTSESGATGLTMTMDAKAYKLMPKLMNPLFKGMIKKAVENDMDLVKTYCESLPKVPVDNSVFT